MNETAFRKRSNVLDGCLDENVLMRSQCGRPHERDGGNPWPCSLYAQPRGMGKGSM